MDYRIKQLENFSDQYKKILDVSTDNMFLQQALKKGYSVEKLNPEERNIKMGFEYISILQNSENVKYDIKNILSNVLKDYYSKEIIIKINSIYPTCFGLSALEILSLIPNRENYKAIDLHARYKDKNIKSEYQVNLIIIKKDLSKSPILNARVGDFIEVPIEKVNIGWFHALDKNCIHPYYLAAKKYLEAKDRKKVFDVLEEFRKNYRVNTPAELLGLEEVEVLNKSSNIFDFVFPWVITEKEDYKNMMLNVVKSENLRYGLNSFEILGGKNCTSQKSKVETKRLCDLVDSIQLSGYQTGQTDPISGYLLIKEEGYKFFINGGNHRAAVLHLLNKKSINLQVCGVININQIEMWKHVQNGTYSISTSKLIFNRVFNSELPNSYINYQQRVNHV